MPEAAHPAPEGGNVSDTSPVGGVRIYAPGDIVDGTYELVSFLGEGGMGTVFSCRHLIMGQIYAIKILSAGQLNADSWTRFQKEGQALAKLKHEGIVGILNMGVDDGQYPYYVMDLLASETLDDLIRLCGRLPVDLALDIFIQVAAALSSAHAHGIIHRDIKPPNLMIVRDADDTIAGIKIVDFGIARLSKQTSADQSQTKTGKVMGSPSYMSPEQCQGRKVDERSDIYSLGCTMFEALTGSPPFLGESALVTIIMHQSATAPRLGSIEPKETFPPTLERAVETMLAKEPAKRYQTMEDVKLDLERIKAGKPLLARLLTALLAEDEAVPGSETVQKNRRIVGANVKHDLKQGLADEKTAGNRKAPRSSKLPLLTAAVAVVLAGVGFACYRHFQQPNQTKTTDLEETIAQNLAPGEQNAQLRRLLKSNIKELRTNAPELRRRLAFYEANTGDSPFKEDIKGFHFPDNLIIGAIRFGDCTPFMATGFVPSPEDTTVCMYLTSFTDMWPDLLDRFGSSDLTGLEIVTKDPEIVIEKLSHWKRLDELAFFNSLTKAIPGEESSYDETAIEDKDLPLIDTLADLKSLGLCGPTISGDAILKMRLFYTLRALKLKRVENLEPLLVSLPARDNLHELWLVGENTTDDQLEALTHMKNLEKLRIRRSKLTPASSRYFKRMQHLDNLYLDRDWSAQEKQQFLKEVPICEFEPVYDFKYWQMFPAKSTP